MNAADLERLPGLPLDEEGPVFKAPWEAQAFALVMRLHAQGLFSWQEWAAQLGRSIAAAREGGDPDLGDTYYQHWLASLEALVLSKGLATNELLDQRKAAIQTEHARLHAHG